MKPYLQFGSLQVNDKIIRVSDKKEFILTRIEPIIKETILIKKILIESTKIERNKINIEIVYYFESTDKLEEFHGTKGKQGFIKFFNHYSVQYHSVEVS